MHMQAGHRKPGHASCQVSPAPHGRKRRSVQGGPRSMMSVTPRQPQASQDELLKVCIAHHVVEPDLHVITVDNDMFALPVWSIKGDLR